MASHVSDRILWIAVFTGAVTACWYIPYFLSHVKEIAADPTPEFQPVEPRLVENAEAAIKLSTIKTLANGPSYPLSVAAINLLGQRLLSDAPTKKALYRDLTSNDWTLRDKAVKALQLIFWSPILNVDFKYNFFHDDLCTALTTALVNLLSEHVQHQGDIPEPVSPLRPTYRSAHETALLKFWVVIIQEDQQYDNSAQRRFGISGTRLAIDCGLIPRWLAKYPFPCTLPKYQGYNFKRHDVAVLFKTHSWGTDDEDMAKLINCLDRLSSGRKQLVDAGLRLPDSQMYPFRPRNLAVRGNPTDQWNSTNLNHDPDDNESEVGALIDHEDLLARLDASNGEPHPVRSEAERSRQRRHREAIVVAEPDAPLRPSNILQRQPTETELAWEREIRDRQSELLGHNESPDLTDEHLADQLARERIDGIDEVAWTPFRPVLPEDAELPDDSHASTISQD